jgi:hypothetical protein
VGKEVIKSKALLDALIGEDKASKGDPNAKRRELARPWYLYTYCRC